VKSGVIREKGGARCEFSFLAARMLLGRCEAFDAAGTTAILESLAASQLFQKSYFGLTEFIDSAAHHCDAIIHKRRNYLFLGKTFFLYLISKGDFYSCGHKTAKNYQPSSQ
jgi:hypothetical protein